MSQIDKIYAIAGVAGALTLAVWAAWILVPTWRSYARWWEKAIAAILSLYVLSALVLAGAGIGAALIIFSRI